MANNEKSSAKMGTVASKAMMKPDSLTNAQIRSLGASVLTSAPRSQAGAEADADAAKEAAISLQRRDPSNGARRYPNDIG